MRRSVPCPGQSVGNSFLALGIAGVAVAAHAHAAGMQAVSNHRETAVSDQWAERLIGARASAAEALSVARAAVDRVHELEEEIAALRCAVSSRDTLIRRLSRNA
ncbi:hypothetical protein GGQ99_005115 [Aminobacter niigataensis]|uniref:Uncharacterized protein n=1 Tax=Aminobacter niigataensis TaxID=83265 RepID=A0ABR6LBD8_9HYPH|nr:hypothetical protein [Aminobacter niigataensis]MBB4653325.1 hypothetical protein [Aminobacter niigataensis]